MRILVAIEPRSYGQAIGSAIRGLRPRLEVVVADPEDLVPEAQRLRPELLFSHLPGSEMPTDEVGVWVELSVEPDRPSTACVGGRLEEITNPDLDDLLSIVDEAEKRFEEGRRLGRSRRSETKFCSTPRAFSSAFPCPEPLLRGPSVGKGVPRTAVRERSRVLAARTRRANPDSAPARQPRISHAALKERA